MSVQSFSQLVDGVVGVLQEIETACRERGVDAPAPQRWWQADTHLPASYVVRASGTPGRGGLGCPEDDVELVVHLVPEPAESRASDMAGMEGLIDVAVTVLDRALEGTGARDRFGARVTRGPWRTVRVPLGQTERLALEFPLTARWTRRPDPPTPETP